MARFLRKSQKKIWNLFWKFFCFYEFPELRKKKKKPGSPKVENFHVFREKVHVFQGKKKDGITKLEIKLDL